jgi:hypothetical protein
MAPAFRFEKRVLELARGQSVLRQRKEAASHGMIVRGEHPLQRGHSIDHGQDGAAGLNPGRGRLELGIRRAGRFDRGRCGFVRTEQRVQGLGRRDVLMEETREFAKRFTVLVRSLEQPREPGVIGDQQTENVHRVLRIGGDASATPGEALERLRSSSAARGRM